MASQANEFRPLLRLHPGRIAQPLQIGGALAGVRSVRVLRRRRGQRWRGVGSGRDPVPAKALQPSAGPGDETQTAARAMRQNRTEVAYLRIPTKAATYSNLIPATIPI